MFPDEVQYCLCSFSGSPLHQPKKKACADSLSSLNEISVLFPFSIWSYAAASIIIGPFAILVIL